MKARISNRIIAKLIDLSIVMLIAAILPRFIGPLIGFFYSLFADGITMENARFSFRGQSIGKKFMGLQTISRLRNTPASFKDSLIRNSPVGVATFFAIIPVWGWIFLVLVGVPLMAMEIYLMRRVETGHRLGDVMADTEVIEAPNR